jgi:hypothetical protein
VWIPPDKVYGIYLHLKRHLTNARRHFAGQQNVFIARHIAGQSDLVDFVEKTENNGLFSFSNILQK